MNYLVFDTETKNTFQDVGSNNAVDLDISVISIYDSQENKISSFLEKDFSKMWPLFEKADVIVGYNSEHFDIPLLNKYYSGDLNQIKSIDLMVYIRESLGRRPKLDDIASATLNTNKSAHGLEAVKWWREGKIKNIIKYCEKDVEITKNLYEFALKNKFVKLRDFSGKIIQIDLNTETWEEKEDFSLTSSLPF
ncbi:MAG: ribonuclease H-like domain-containing protein [Candidatus Shapirobacteria bacterium]|nr:ribonuclease H-like domain-containing protein [Candidatus Shapirobacteria bacterium]